MAKWGKIECAEDDAVPLDVLEEYIDYQKRHAEASHASTYGIPQVVMHYLEEVKQFAQENAALK